ncbi:sulfite exporter TauE/SafE family protein [Thermodesulfobium sp. 4217-1]|uniref:urease accessory protein UreH domain-containing protein n=1 Tax=Thermodesulfobium sp. 4217-1 TaxID=3120013 RepID=UPI003221C82F
MDLFNVHAQSSVLMTLVLAYLLGVVHGITPDEHTWPITFSYSIGSYSAKKGFFIGLAFSLAFSLQRAIASELAYFSLISFMSKPYVDYIVYAVIGVAMVLGGLYIFNFNDVFHIHLGKIDNIHHKEALSGKFIDLRHKKTTYKMAIIHGFIAGWGFGAFALILYTILAPSMPNAYVAWLPGFVFGLGTTTVQILAGALFGILGKRLNLPESVSQHIARLTAARTLILGGVLFSLSGIIGLIDPKLLSFNIVTPIKVHNLHNLNIGFFLVIAVVLGIGITTFLVETIKYRKIYKTI